MKMLTPTELIETYNEVRECFPEPAMLGYLFLLGLVEGRRNARKTMLDVPSVLKICAFKKDNCKKTSKNQ